jgi:hypothetical protein
VTSALAAFNLFADFNSTEFQFQKRKDKRQDRTSNNSLPHSNRAYEGYSQNALQSAYNKMIIVQSYLHQMIVLNSSQNHQMINLGLLLYLTVI